MSSPTRAGGAPDRSGAASVRAGRPHGPRVGGQPGGRVAVAEATTVPAARVLWALRRQRKSTPGVMEPIGIAGTPDTTAGVQWRTADCASPSVVGALQDVDVLVWVAAETDLESALQLRPTSRREMIVRTAQTLITAAAAAGVARLVVITSAMVYGAEPGNPVPLPEDHPLGAARDGGVVGDLLAVEDVVSEARRVHPHLDITVVRPAALVGMGIDTVVTRHFEAPRLLTVKGAEPTWQFCHVDDLATAVVVAVTSALGPAITVAAEGYLAQERVEQLSGMRRIQLSQATALGTAARLHRFGVLPAPASELAFAMYPWVVEPTLLREAGWRPAYDNETCLGVLLDSIRGRSALAGRRVAPKDAALGAASAAVALVGTAAVLRRARRP